MIDDVVAGLKGDEGFRGKPYKCSEGILTVGYGTTFPLTKKEATVLLRMRAVEKLEKLKDLYIFNMVKPEAQAILVNMSYQMGFSGLMKFRNMWKALENQDYQKAAKEGRDSLWYRQTPNRAERLMRQMDDIT